MATSWLRGVINGNAESTQSPVTVYERSADDYVGDVTRCMAQIRELKERTLDKEIELRAMQVKLIEHFADIGLPFLIEPKDYDYKPYRFEDGDR